MLIIGSLLVQPSHWCKHIESKNKNSAYAYLIESFELEQGRQTFCISIASVCYKSL